MQHFHLRSFRRQAILLRRQFLQDGGLADYYRREARREDEERDRDGYWR